MRTDRTQNRPRAFVLVALAGIQTRRESDIRMKTGVHSLEKTCKTESHDDRDKNTFSGFIVVGLKIDLELHNLISSSFL